MARKQPDIVDTGFKAMIEGVYLGLGLKLTPLQKRERGRRRRQIIRLDRKIAKLDREIAKFRKKYPELARQIDAEMDQEP
jgi:hypothetical protein